MQTNELVSNSNQQTPGSQPANASIPQQQPSGVYPPAQESVQGEKLDRWLIIGLGIFALVAIGTAGVFAYQNYQLKKQVEKPSSGPEVTRTETLQPTPTSTISVSSPTPTADPTVNWKTYTNETNNYVIKIPQDWVTDDKKHVFIGLAGEVTFTPLSEMGLEGEAGEVFRTKVAITAMTTEKIRYTLNTQEQFDEWLMKDVSSGEGERLFKVGNVKVGGFDAVRFVSRSLPGDPSGAYYGVVTWLRKNGANYYLELYSTSEGKASGFTSLYDQILSTFQFTN